MAKYRTITSVLSNHSSKYHALYTEAQQLVLANRLLQSLLSKPLNTHVRISQMKQNTLVIAVDSATWLTKARMQVIDIFDDFKQKSGMKELTQTQFKIHPYLSYADNNLQTPAGGPADKAKPTPLSTKTLSQISEVAENLEDARLKQACCKLVATLKARDKSNK